MITDNNKIADSKLKNNVSEFIIYMYQMEDLCRVYQFNIADIEQYVIHHFPVSSEEKVLLKVWFESLMEQMKNEQIEESGHLAEVQQYVNRLLDLKNRLLTTDEEFAAVYNAARPHIRQSLMEANAVGKKINSDIQVCLNGIYGLLLCRMNGREVPEELNDGIDAFGNVLSYLSFKYKQEDMMSPN
ncbi:DUF4924 family protein [Fulvivirga sedimenti]|uniref:DUF4924 family protein n=1 Tax=Fulvivirga sedimenti TaxID=2879465 RepID=A0A9X1L294_9BACT|nr:DUF4924 family protein [Fulvivirga sedimenti]MCA6077911.1 DUF4924 family protein [Fulvivirga sedimenti]